MIYSDSLSCLLAIESCKIQAVSQIKLKLTKSLNVEEEIVYLRISSHICINRKKVIYHKKAKDALAIMTPKTYFSIPDSETNCIGGVIVSVLASYRSGQDYNIGICCFSAKCAALRRKNKDWLAPIQIMCPIGATYLSADCCFSELTLN